MESARCKAFIASVELGSFSKAAELLSYTPSGVSQLVSALEREFGFPLLRRSAKGVQVTDNGERLLPAIREFLVQENRIYESVAEINGLIVGRVNIGTYTSIARHWLPGVIRVFQEKYPEIDVFMSEGTREEITEMLDGSIVDIGFFSYMEPMQYDWIPLAEDRLLALIPKTHPLAGASAYPIGNCEQELFIMPGSGYDSDVLVMLDHHGISPNVRFSPRESFDVMTMVEQNLGMGIMNELITRRWECDIVKLPLDPPQQITLGLAVPSLKNAAPAVRQFVKHAVKLLSTVEKG